MKLTPGDPAPWFTTRSSVNPNFHFDTVGGRYIVLCFVGSCSTAVGRQILQDAFRAKNRLDVTNICFFAVTNDLRDEQPGNVDTSWPGIIYFWDTDHAINALYGVKTYGEGPEEFKPCAVVLDPAMRVIGLFTMGDNPQEFFPRIDAYVGNQTPVASMTSLAPVLTVPWVFEPEFCKSLVSLYEQSGGQESGYMQDINGKTTAVLDYNRKRRSDCEITDQQVIRAAQARLQRRLVPQIKRAFQFDVTRIERHIVVCYDAQTSGHFKAHRDNTTKGTAHRRFAVTLNLNAEEYEGGDLRFPEFGMRTYRAPTGGAVVFSCSLLHEAMPVTKGKRYAFLPFLYDDAAAVIRRENVKYLAGNEPTAITPA